jgi:predicted SAM-dependent methyltransferase
MSAELKLAKSVEHLRLDLACGQRPKDGFTGVDKYAPNAEKVDLLSFPWPWEDNSVDEVHCSHFIEHIPMGDVTYADGVTTKDYFFAFFDELYRVLRPDGFATIIWPYLKSVRAFQDPTHKRFIPGESMLYLNRDWRKANGLDHYQVNCHFGSNTNFSFDSGLSLRVQEVQQRMFKESWDQIYDMVAVLKPIK